jgi:hypothetical protein
MAENLSLQQAQRLQNFIQRMEAVPDRTPAENDALARARAAMPEQTIGEFGAGYRGLAQGVTLGAGDEMRAALAGITPRGQDYEQALEEQRRLNLEAQMMDPEMYAKGRTYGQIGTGAASMAIPGVGGMGPVASALTGAGIGAASAAAPSFLEAEGGFQRRLSQVPPVQTAVGGLLGAAVPVAGMAAGGMTRLAEGLGRSIPGAGARASQVAARGVGRTAATGEDIQEYLRSLGPEAMLADVPGGPQAQAMGLAAQQGEGGTVVSQALRRRGEAAEGRIDRAVTDVAGEPGAAFRQRMELEQERTGVLGPAYEAAKTYPDTLDVTDTLQTIDSLLPDAIGGNAARLNLYKRQLSEGGGEISAARLHNIRSQISDTINAAARQARGGTVKALKPVLDQIDNELDRVPNYAETRTGYANVREMERQIDAGRAVLSPGRSTVSPDELRQSFSAMTEPQQEAFRTGAREYIAALMGTSRNAPASAWSELTTGFNDRKLRILFGDDEAEKIMQTLRAERAFSETRGRVTSGSMTAQRQMAEEELGPVRSPDTGRMPGPIARIRNTLNDTTNAAIDSVLYGSRRSTANQELGKILSLQGPERDRAVQALLLEAQRQQGNTRAQAVVRMLTQMGLGGTMAATMDEETR